MIKALIFDFDGLILDTEGPIYKSWQELYQTHGGQLTLEIWSTFIGTVSNEYDHFEELEAQLGRPVDQASLSPRRRQRELELIAQQQTRPGVENLLKEARQAGLKIGLASSSPCAWVEGHLSRLGLIAYFDCLRARDDVSQVKPEPELYLSVLAELGVQADEAIVIEDSPIGVTAAKRASLYCVAVPNELTRWLPLDHADRLLATLEGITLQDLMAEAAENHPGREIQRRNRNSPTVG